MKTIPYLFLLLCGLFYVPVFAQELNQKITDYDAYVEQNRKRFDVPGCAVAIVHKGEVIFSKGYGYLSIDKKQEVNRESLFGIMSTTKAMTAVAMGILVDEGKVKWDDLLIDYLPEFQLYDAYATRHLRIRDLFTHNAGLGNTDFLWAWDSKASADYILHQMRYAEPAYPFRGGYTYQNIMYLVAGELIEKLSGMSWERFMKERVYSPLGMTNTFANLSQSAQYANRSQAHQRLNKEIIRIDEMSADPIAPAGATWSTIEDMAKWVQFMLESGDGLIQSSTKAEILKPQVIIPKGQFYPTAQLTRPNWTTYGLGWFQQDYRGRMLHFHTGSLDGRTALIALMKEADFGFYFFGNLDHAELRHALMLRALDAFVFEDAQLDWGEEVHALYEKLEADRESHLSNRRANRVEGTDPSHGLEAYTGTYSHPFYGSAKIYEKEGALHFTIGREHRGHLEHWHYDTFAAHPDKKWRTSSPIQFNLDAGTGEVSKLTMGGINFYRN